MDKALAEGSWYSRHREAILSAVFSVAWMLCAHAYRWFNAASASHDSLAFFTGWGEATHQIGLGRFLVPLYTQLRGGIAAPLLVGLLATVFLAGAVMLVVKCLNMRHPLAIGAVAGALATSISVTLLNASYTNWFDVDMLALFLAVLGVYCAVRGRGRGRLRMAAGAVALAASMALYQAYLSVYLGFALIVVVAHAVDADQPKDIVRLAARLVAVLVIGGVLYFACMQGALAIASASLVEGYNGLGGATDFSGVSVPRLLLEAYALPIAYLLSPETHGMQVVGVLNGVLAVVCLIGLFVTTKRNRCSVASKAIAAGCVVLLPLAVDAVYLVSHGVVHGLMIQSFSLFYVFVVLVADRWSREQVARGRASFAPSTKRMSGVVAVGAVVAVLAASACNAVYANDLYTIKDLQAQSTLTQFTRIADRMDATDGYVPGQTEVVFVGSLEDSAATAAAHGMEPASGRTLLPTLTGKVRSTGFFGSHAVTYLQTYGFYFKYVLGEDIVVLGEAVAEEYAQLPAVQALSSYPSQDCCALVDGRLVVKLS